jgi:hypothetical protein
VENPVSHISLDVNNRRPFGNHALFGNHIFKVEDSPKFPFRFPYQKQRWYSGTTVRATESFCWLGKYFQMDEMDESNFLNGL